MTAAAHTPWKAHDVFFRREDGSTEILRHSVVDCEGTEVVADAATDDVRDLLVRAVNAHDHMLAEMRAAAGYLRNAHIDLATGATKATAMRTIEGGLKRLETAIGSYEKPA